jgi:hypothetical protein
MAEQRTYEIEVFRVGPSSRGITTKEVDEAITTYDADKAPAPLVIGHPTSDKPAHGWIKALRREGDKLLATIGDVSNDLIDKVKAKAFRNRSIAFWHPEHSANPAAGKWGIRHLGFLGAASPGIPNMKPLSFSADETTIESEDAPEAAVVFAEDKSTPITTITEGGKKVPDPKDETVAKAEFDAIVAERDELKRQTEAAAKRAEDERKSANAAFVDNLIKEGRVTPGDKVLFTEILNRLPVDEVQFDADRKGGLADELKKALSATEPRVIFSEVSPKGERGDGSKLSADQITAKANQMVKDGKALNFEAAVEAIEKGA